MAEIVFEMIAVVFQEVGALVFNFPALNKPERARSASMGRPRNRRYLDGKTKKPLATRSSLFNNLLRNSPSIGHDGQRRVCAGAGWEWRAVYGVEIADLMRAAPPVGSSRMKISGSALSHFAITTFC